jgi:hypothetical protein
MRGAQVITHQRLRPHGAANEPGENLRRPLDAQPHLHKWRLLGVSFSEKVGGDRAIYAKELRDGTRLVARVRDNDSRPLCDEITTTFPAGARDFGRELAISELERVINDNDQLWFRDARTGQPCGCRKLNSGVVTGQPYIHGSGLRGRRVVGRGQGR